MLLGSHSLLYPSYQLRLSYPGNKILLLEYYLKPLTLDSAGGTEPTDGKKKCKLWEIWEGKLKTRIECGKDITCSLGVKRIALF